MRLFLLGDRLIKVKADPNSGFHYDYYLFIPKGAKDSGCQYLLVEPNNSGQASDDSTFHAKKAENLARYGVCSRLSKELSVPLLVPTYDRPESEWEMYTHALDSDTLKNRDGRLARIDLQLIAMIQDAQNRLRKKGFVLLDKVFMNGFSASGSFVNRFAVLHPEWVRAVAAGGVNCMPILPVAQWEGHRLPYHIGVADIDTIADISFNINEYKKVAQYIYMGALDDNDTLPYQDAFNEDERNLVELVMGDSMANRWQKAKSIYTELDIPAQLIMYPEVGHKITPQMEKDLKAFFKQNSFIG